MKKEFTKNEMNNNKGCYSLSKLNKCSFINLPTIGIIDILNSEIPLKDKGWFLVKKTDLTIDQKKELALLLAKSVIEIYNKKYPNDNRVSDCIDAIELFNSGKITIDELRNKRNSAAAAYSAAADAAAADAAYSAVAAAYSAVADAADAAVAAVAAAADAAYSAAAAAYSAAVAAAYSAAAAAVAAAYSAAAAAADAAYSAATAADAYKQKVLQVMIDFVNNN